MFAKYMREIGLINSRILAIVVLTFLCVFAASAQTTDQTVEPGEVLRVDTKLVELKVSVLGAAKNAAAPALKPADFTILEDGKAQTVQFFAAAEAPFDLVLLLDVSGSSAGKLKLIRKAAERFIKAARPEDRIAVLTFSGELNLIAPLNIDRDKLKASLKNIDEGVQGTVFWDSLRYTLTHIPGEQTTGRRSAVVVMTDGVDNALPGERGEGSVTTFLQLMEFIRESPAIVVPIYLDTEEEMLKKSKYQMSAASFATARGQLQSIAADGGSTLYYARRVEDLNGVFEQVIHDLGTVYSIGYESDCDPDGKWRKISVALPGHPGLTVRTRPGYYATGK